MRLRSLFSQFSGLDFVKSPFYFFPQLTFLRLLNFFIRYKFQYGCALHSVHHALRRAYIIPYIFCSEIKRSLSRLVFREIVFEILAPTLDGNKNTDINENFCIIVVSGRLFAYPFRIAQK